VSARRLAVAAAHALAVAAAAVAMLGGPGRDFSVPLRFSGDGLVFGALSKGTFDNGWWWTNPWLSAPSTFDALAFPANANLDQLLVRGASALTGSPALALTSAWIASLALGAVLAAACLQRLGLSLPLSLALGTLFGLSPYALYRDVDHFSLLTYLVPLPCTLALLLAADRLPAARDRRLALLVAGCGLLGFNYVYYAFFGCFFLLVGGVLGSLSGRSLRPLRVGCAAVALVVACTALNLQPSLRSWREHGRPVAIRDKVPAEAEVYGLKVRHLVSPLFEHSFPPFRAWTTREARAAFPQDTENTTSRLGALGTLGFLALLLITLAPEAAARLPDPALALAAGRLVLAGLLLATTGAFGSLFNLLVTPEIRAYNRIAPFLAFLSLLGLGALVQRAVRGRKALAWTAAVVLAALGCADQAHALRRLNMQHAATAAEFAAVRQLVGALEARLPGRAQVLQLPFTSYLNDGGRARMKPYDHFRPYLASRSLHWSYPALSNQQVEWQARMAALSTPRLLAAARSAGFSAVLVDRHGYPGGARRVLEQARGLLGTESVLASDERYVALDLRALDASLVPATDAGAGEPLTAGLPRCDGAFTANFDQVGPWRAPFDALPLRLAARTVPAAGWALLPGATAPEAIELVVDGEPVATLPERREDVARYFGIPAAAESGFRAELRLGALERGPHRLAIRAVEPGGRCYREGRVTPIEVR
jgi:phosphoglycerol transferase